MLSVTTGKCRLLGDKTGEFSMLAVITGKFGMLGVLTTGFRVLLVFLYVLSKRKAHAEEVQVWAGLKLHIAMVIVYEIKE